MTTPAVEVQNLTSTYGAFTAVDDLSFHVNTGELYALLGTNGAGRTTTLETIEGHRAPSDGKVAVFGGSPADRAGIRPRVGMMLQESGFAGDLTLEETVNLIGRLFGRSRRHANRSIGTEPKEAPANALSAYETYMLACMYETHG